jgi:integrase
MIGYSEEVVGWLERKGVKTLDDITSYHLADLAKELQRADRKCGRRRGPNSAAVVNKKLGIIKLMGDVATSHKPPLARSAVPKMWVDEPVVLKWWLTPDMKDRLVPWLREERKDGLMADYVEFVCATGLRVEEVLRLWDYHFIGLDTDEPSLTVPGTKTADAQATLPISKTAAEIARRRIADRSFVKLFPLKYETLRAKWLACREFLGQEGSTTCTLKAMRRTFAKFARNRDMPKDDLQLYLRHASRKTTEGYLQLVGGAEDLEATRRWL